MIPKRIKRLKPYKFPKFNRDRLNLNENPFPIPEIVLLEFKEKVKAEDIRLYHSPVDNIFISSLEEYTGFDKENLSIVNGADEGIYFLISMFGKEGFSVVSFSPSYKCYKEFSYMQGVKFFEIPLKDDFTIDIDRTLNEIKNKRILFFIPNPNNPTGNLFERDKILKIIERTKGFVVIDEAYFEFSKVTFTSLIERFNNLIILRTFSKSFSLAGERIGYIISNKEFISRFNGFKNPYNFPYLSMIMGSVVVRHRDIFFERIEWIKEERERVFNELKGVNSVKVFPSKTNFLLTYVRDYKRFRELLKREEIEVLDLEDGFFRISIGRRELNNKVLDIFKRI